MYGTWLHRKCFSLRPLFLVPGFVAPRELKAILPHLPANDVGSEQLDLVNGPDCFVPAGAGSSLMRKMMFFWQEANETYRRHAHSFDQAYEVVSHASKPLEIHIKEIAARVCGWENIENVPQSSLWALHRVLFLHHAGFYPTSRSHWKLQSWLVVPRSQLKIMDQVKIWVREYQDSVVDQRREDPQSETSRAPPRSIDASELSCFQRFISEARAVVLENRKRRQRISNYGIGPYHVPEGNADHSSDAQSSPTSGVSIADGPSRLILEFLKLWTIDMVIPPGSHLSAIGPTILRATGLYTDLPLDCGTAFVFLKETGYIAPWASKVGELRQLHLPIGDPESVTNQLRDAADLSADKVRFVDKMKALRKDWGNMEVFCIDSESTQDVDDGFSLEEIPGETRSAWVHVHVANPTAFIPPSSPMARYAERLGKSVYGVEKRHSMLPSTITERFSVGAGRPVLTFSCQVDVDGQILDYRITPGQVHNVIFASYTTLLESLEPGQDTALGAFELSVGSKFTESTNSQAARMVGSFTKRQLQTLRKLRELCRASRRYRSLQGSVVGRIVSQLPQPTVQGSQPFHCDGDPSIRLEGTAFDPFDDGVPAHLQNVHDASIIVPELMIVACEGAGRWCRERDIPVMFLSNAMDPALPPLSEYRRKVLDPIFKKGGKEGSTTIPLHVFTEFMGLYGVKNISPFPRPHNGLGVGAYAQCTSPLRRYRDLVCHWQIEARLLHEEAVRKGAQARGSAPALPFRLAQLEELCISHLAREADQKRTESLERRHWSTQLLFRKFYFGEGDPLPKTFTLYVRYLAGQGRRGEVGGVIRELNMSAYVLENEVSQREGGFQRGTWWEGRIVSVETYECCVVMEPIRKIS